jgi:hypothetical protein
MNPKFVAGSGAGAGGDTLSLAHLDGTDAATTTTDEVAGVTITLTNAELDTAQKKFGTASVLLEKAGVLGNAQATGMAGGAESGNWTFEGVVRSSSSSGSAIPRPTLRNADEDISVELFFDFAAEEIIGGVFDSAGDEIVPLSNLAVTLSVNTQYHWAVVREGSAYSLFFDGNRIDTDTSATNARPFTVWRVEDNGTTGDAWFDEVRVSKVARYSGATYTVPIAAFTVD